MGRCLTCKHPDGGHPTLFPLICSPSCGQSYNRDKAKKTAQAIAQLITKESAEGKYLAIVAIKRGGVSKAFLKSSEFIQKAPDKVFTKFKNKINQANKRGMIAVWYQSGTLSKYYKVSVGS